MENKIELINALSEKLGIAVDKLQPFGKLLISQLRMRCLFGAFAQGIATIVFMILGMKCLSITFDYDNVPYLSIVFFVIAGIMIIACCVNIAEAIAPELGMIEKILK